MLVALIAHDKPDALHIRQENRDAHIHYLEKSSGIDYAGPFLDEDGNMCGSLLILDVPDLESAQRWADNDPYAKAGLFESVMLKPWKKVVVNDVLVV